MTQLPSGLYAITVKGHGNSPKITEERFTSKREANVALLKYQHVNAKDIEKRDYMNRRHPKPIKE